MVVVRFSPFAAERLIENAEDTYVDDGERGLAHPRYGISVLACERLELGSEATVEHIVASTTLTGKTIAVVTDSQLRAIGLDLIPDPTDVEPLHCLLGVKPFTAIPPVDKLASLLQDGRMRNPAWQRGGA